MNSVPFKKTPSYTSANRWQSHWRMTIHVIPSFPPSPPTTVSLYIRAPLINWTSGSFSKLEMPMLYHDIKGERVPRGHLDDCLEVRGPHSSREDTPWRSRQDYSLWPDSPSKKSYLILKQAERWEGMLFKLGWCPTEIFNTDVQKLKYSAPTTMQKLESPRWDYWTRSNIYVLVHKRHVTSPFIIGGLREKTRPLWSPCSHR